MDSPVFPNKGGPARRAYRERDLELADALAVSASSRSRKERVTRSYFDKMATWTGGAVADSRRWPRDAQHDANARLSAIPLYQPMLRTTCTWSTMVARACANASSGAARSHCRLPPGKTTEVSRTERSVTTLSHIYAWER